MTNRGESIRVMHPLFQTGEGGSIPTSPLQMRVMECRFQDAKALNRMWHSRLPKLCSVMCRVAYAAEFGGKTYAVAIWSRPVSHKLPQYEWLELQRMAVAPDAPKNTASWMLGVMARLIRKRLPDIDRLISYQDTEVHTGGIYKAAGWVPTTLSSGDTWDRPSRARKQAQSTAAKQRWEKVIREVSK